MYFSTEHKKGFVSDVKINESIMYKDRYEPTYTWKVNNWLRPFGESIEASEIVLVTVVRLLSTDTMNFSKKLKPSQLQNCVELEISI